MDDPELYDLQTAIAMQLEREHQAHIALGNVDKAIEVLAPVPEAMRKLFGEIENLEESQVVKGHHPVHKADFDEPNEPGDLPELS